MNIHNHFDFELNYPGCNCKSKSVGGTREREREREREMYKSKLQELCHQKSWSLPEYVSTKDGPDHNPRFTATATVIINSNSPPQTFHSSNPCKSSKEAQNDAARIAFLHFTQPPPPPPPSITIRSNSSFASFPQPSLPSSSSFSGNYIYY